MLLISWIVPQVSRNRLYRARSIYIDSYLSLRIRTTTRAHLAGSSALQQAVQSSESRVHHSMQFALSVTSPDAIPPAHPRGTRPTKGKLHTHISEMCVCAHSDYASLRKDADLKLENAEQECGLQNSFSFLSLSLFAKRHLERIEVVEVAQSKNCSSICDRFPFEVVQIGMLSFPLPPPTLPASHKLEPAKLGGLKRERERERQKP